jgi:hypothetical protein
MEYAKEVDIANDRNECAIGSDGDNEPLAEGKDKDDNEYASAICCAESIIPSATPAESIILSALAESIMLSVPPAECMILSAPPAEIYRACALRVSAQACPHAESIRL